MPRVTISIPEKTPQPYRFQLDREVVTIGRGSENDIPVPCGSVSVRHAEMRRVHGGYELRDLGSTNGIKLDGEKRPRVTLHSGMKLQLGDVSFEFVLSDSELQTLAAERDASPQDDQPDESGENPSSGTDEEVRDGVASLGSSFGLLLLFLVLAAAAFVAGMAVRYQKETGNSWLEAVKARIDGPADTPQPNEEAPSDRPAP